jgi:hypothetical protein
LLIDSATLRLEPIVTCRAHFTTICPTQSGWKTTRKYRKSFLIVGFADIKPRRQLSGDALAALKDFYSERDTRQKQFEQLKSASEDDFEGKLSMDAFTEDWNASQFWYSDETAMVLARQLLEGATDETRIAVVSAPSAFIQLKNLLVSGAVGFRSDAC